MNRLQAWDDAEIAAPASVVQFDAGQFSSARVDQPCSFFAPLHYEKNYAYPLLVWLHGPGDDENQIKRVMPFISLRNYVAVSIRGTQKMPLAGGRTVYTWSDHPAHVSQAEQRLFDAIELAQERFHIAPRRVFLAGYDAGGGMALRLALAHPRQFAGVLSVCGAFPRQQTPLRWLHDVQRLPIFLAYGRDSVSYPVEQVCESLRLFHAARLKVNLFQYPCNQQVTTKMLEDMDRWMMERVTGAPAAVEA